MPTNRSKKSANIGEVGVKGEEVKHRGENADVFYGWSHAREANVWVYKIECYCNGHSTNK